jgi:hypothetical protein
LLQPLREHRDEVNLEAALVLGGDLVVISRGNAGTPANLVARFPMGAVAGWLDGATSRLPAPRVASWDVGAVHGVPLGVTDAAPLPDGGWVFAAAAEDTSDAYADGAVVGAVVGRVAPSGAVTAVARITPVAKVEGILARPAPLGTEVLMVTDADDPNAAASLLTVLLPA